MIGSQGGITADSQYVFLLGGSSKTAGSNSILLGNGDINAENVTGIFVYSNLEESFEPQQSSAFYVNSKMGITATGKMPQVSLDIEQGGVHMTGTNVLCNSTLS